MIPLLHAIPLDLTASAINNRTKGEIHDISKQFDLPYRIVVLEKGYFYTDNLFILDNRGKTLKEDIDYQCISMNKEIAKKTGRNACAVILITNPSVGNYLRIDAQMVGGVYTMLTTAILEMAFNVMNTINDKVYWKNITDKPSEFRPNGHLHALWELYGFTPQVNILKRITTAIDKASASDFDDLFGEYINEMRPIRSEFADVEQLLTNHIKDEINPHRLTATQVGLQLVTNGSPATYAQASTGSNAIMDAYATPYSAKVSVAFNYIPKLNSHVTDYLNPHADTAAKLGTITNVELIQLSSNYYNVGETVNATEKLGGYSISDTTYRARQLIPIKNITSGILTWYANGPNPAGCILAPGPSGEIRWQSIRDLFDRFEPKANQVIYTGITISNTTNSARDLHALLTQLNVVIGVNYPNGTIAIFKHIWWFVGKSRGYKTTIAANLGMATLLNGRWIIPGWPNM